MRFWGRLLLLAACGDTECVLRVDAADDTVPGDGHSTTEINATADETFGTKSVTLRRTPRPGGQQIVENLPVNTAPTGTLKMP